MATQGFELGASVFLRIFKEEAELEVWVEKDGEQVNGKSIMGLMMLAAGKGSNLVVRAEGAAIDAERMLGELVDLFERRFEEV
ncbi:MAG: HPr family phosphocarrier protein [Kordiimonadaceae bacterium]|nr:HPr family phosphocarrier protein [Kordiimonadaceae bacterium]